MKKIVVRLLIVIATGTSLLFGGVLYSYLNTQKLVMFGQDSFGEVAVTLNGERDSAASASFEAVGLSPTLLQGLNAQVLSTADWQQIYSVTLIDEKLKASQLPMLGVYSIEAGTVRFVPRFPLIPGQAYRAELSFDTILALIPTLADDIPADLHHKTVVGEFGLPRSEMPATEVIAVYPTADQLPENLLRFYVYFSDPMRDGFALEQVHLVDAQGQEVEGVFFDAIFELWDPSMQRLTLLFDPGRVKTGLRAHEQLGRALIPGQSYTLVIGAALLDAHGSPLARSYEKAFTVIEADLTPPNVSDWQMTSPPTESIEPLEIRFPAPLDHGLLAEFVRIQATNGEIVPGQIELDNHETVWRFTPAEPWQAGLYELTVNTRLEDIAGNNLHGLFDTPPEKKLTLMDRRTVTLPLQIQ